MFRAGFCLAVASALSLGACIPSGRDSIRTVQLPTHTGVNVDDVDTFTGALRAEGDCFVYSGVGGGTILPIWPTSYIGKLAPRAVEVYRPEDPPDYAFNVASEILEFDGERLELPDDLDVTLEVGVPAACREFDMFLVVETIQRS